MLFCYGFCGCVKNTKNIVTPIPISTPPPPTTITTSNYITGFYNMEYELKGNSVYLSYDASNNPLLVKLSISPQYVQRQKYVFYSESESNPGGYYVTENFVDPNSYLHLEIRDIDTNRVVAETGFGGTYSQDLTKEAKVHRLGIYRIILTGNRLKVNLKITPSL